MNILVVDDDIDCLEDLIAAFEPAGYRCDKFTSPEAALEAYKKNQYDVVICDLKMPGMNGLELMKMILFVNPGARVIINTGFGDEKTVTDAFNNGAYAFFCKPIDLHNLMETLESIA